MKNKKWILSIVLCLLPIAAYLALYDQLPDMIPSHFNAEGAVDGYMPKDTAVYLPSQTNTPASSYFSWMKSNACSRFSAQS